MKIRTIHLLGLLGGIITVVLGAIALIVGSRAVMLEQFGKLGVYYGIWTLGVGILLLIGTWLIPKERGTRVGAILLIVFGVAGVVTLTGWIAGPLLGLIAGVAAVKKK
jgi:hypothetical protein